MGKNKQKIVCIIQARMGSSRLPGKVLMDIQGKPMLERVVDRVKRAQTIDQIILAIPINKDSDVLEDFAKEHSLEYFRGSSDNVLDRYYQTAKHFNCDVIVRITADCPLMDKDVIDLVVKTHLEQDNDFTSNALEQTFPLGISAEAMTFEALEKAAISARERYQKEHVTPYIIERPDIFKLGNVQAQPINKRPKIRLTVDEKDDINLVREIYKNFRDQDYFGLEKIIQFLDSKPELLNINANVQQKKAKD